MEVCFGDAGQVVSVNLTLFSPCRVVTLSVLQEAQEQRPFLQPLLLPVSGPA